MESLSIISSGVTGQNNSCFGLTRENFGINFPFRLIGTSLQALAILHSNS